MIAGCYMLNGDLGLRVGELPRLLLLVATLNAYELLLIALGLYLIRGRGIGAMGEHSCCWKRPSWSIWRFSMLRWHRHTERRRWCSMPWCLAWRS